MKLLIYISQWSLVLLLFLSTGLKAGEPLQFTKSYSKALKQAQKEDKLIFCFVYTSWSMPSQRMEETTLKDSLVVQELNAEYVTLYINASRNKDFAKDFEIHVFPSMLVIDKWGNAILRDSGYKSSTQLITMIYKTRSKSRYLRQSIDSLMMDVNSENILATVDSIILYRDEYTAKNI
ncbi:MAG: thioredoxin family protein, partial [Saprospiraceae bacterium]